MPAPVERSTVLVLAPADGRERFETWELFDRDAGKRLGLRRLTTGKGKPLSRPDVFDTGEATLRSGAGHAWFLEDYRPLKRRSALAQNFVALEAASALGNRVRRHLEHIDDLPHLFDLLVKAWDALAAGHVPAVVQVKMLYAWAQAEGYPVQQAWWAMLSAADQAEAMTLLQRPLRDLAADPATVGSILTSLCRYLAAETELGI